jgi:flagellar protein FlgJ
MRIYTKDATVPYWDIQGLNTKKDIDEVVKEFEAIFVKMILKEFRKSIPEGGLFGNTFAANIYWDMFDMQLSQTIAESNSLGLQEYIKNAISIYQQHSTKE